MDDCDGEGDYGAEFVARFADLHCDVFGFFGLIEGVLDRMYHYLYISRFSDSGFAYRGCGERKRLPERACLGPVGLPKPCDLVGLYWVPVIQGYPSKT